MRHQQLVDNDSCRACRQPDGRTHRLCVLLQGGEAEVVDGVAGADQKGDAVALQQLEVVVVRLVPEEVLDRVCNEEKSGMRRCETSYK